MKKCCIICGGPEGIGDIPLNDLGFIICADSGYDKALSRGLKPDLIIGDFDSVKSALPKDCPIMRLPAEKNDTDTLFAVKTALEKGYNDITLIGAGNGREDHFLANISTLLYIKNQGAAGRIAGENTNAVILGKGTHAIAADMHRCLSVFPVTDNTVVSLAGVKYELCRYTLRTDFPIGVSNEFTDKPCTVTVHEGTVIAMSVKKH